MTHGDYIAVRRQIADIFRRRRQVLVSEWMLRKHPDLGEVSPGVMLLRGQIERVLGQAYVDAEQSHSETAEVAG